MRLRIVTLVAALAFGGVLLCGGALSQEKEKTQAAAREEMEAVWAKAAEPGEFHKHMEALQGTWEMDGVSWMAPGAEPMTWSGTSEKTMIMGGRFLREEVHSEMMGEVFTGIGILGYNNLTGKYWHIWYDDMSTGLTTSEGTCDGNGKVFTLVGEYDDAMTGEREKAKTVLTVVGDDKHVFESFKINPDGSEFKSMEIAYTRK